MGPGGWTRRVESSALAVDRLELTPPYVMATTHAATALNDAERMAKLLNAAFRRTQHTGHEYRTFMTSSPSFEHLLNLVALAPDGSFAAHVGVTYDAVNRHGIFEPVCTHPDHVRNGLARALINEGMRRLAQRGAVSACVETGDMEPANALYRACGFVEEYRGHWYERSL
jgi:ribosomal protein S18 acetylase RimI-like enzyme